MLSSTAASAAVEDPENGPKLAAKNKPIGERIPLGNRSNWQVKPIESEIIIPESTDGEEEEEVEVEVDWDEEGNPIMTTSVSKLGDLNEEGLALREALAENEMLWGRVRKLEAEVAQLRAQLGK